MRVGDKIKRIISLTSSGGVKYTIFFGSSYLCEQIDRYIVIRCV